MKVVKAKDEPCKCKRCEKCGWDYPARMIKLKDGRMLCPYHRGEE